MAHTSGGPEKPPKKKQKGWDNVGKQLTKNAKTITAASPVINTGTPGDNRKPYAQLSATDQKSVDKAKVHQQKKEMASKVSPIIQKAIGMTVNPPRKKSK